MKQKIYKKIFVIGLVVLFFGASVVPAVFAATHESKNIPATWNQNFLLIPDSTAKSVGMYDPYDGTYLGDIIVDATRFSTPINAVLGPDGDIYVSDQVADSVFVYDTDGNYLYTYADSTDGLDNIRGIDFRDGELFVSMGNIPKCIARFSGPHNRLPNFIEDGIDPFDILFLSDGRSLVADIEGTTDNIRLYDVDGILIEILFPINFPEQIQFDSLAPGAFLNAAFSANVISDFDLDGTIVESTPYSSGRGVFRLGNGNILATSSAGIQEIQPGTGTVIETKKTGSGRFIEMFAFITDTTPPTSQHQLDGTMGDNNWFISCVTITIEATDDESGVDAIFYKLDDGTWTEYTEPVEVCTDGQHTFDYYAVDKAGNEETPNSGSFKLDKTPPVWTDYTFTPLNILKNKWLCVATVTDETSGITMVEFYVDDASVGTVTTTPYEFQYNGVPTNSSHAIAYDAAGNSAISPVASYVKLSGQQQYYYYPNMQTLKMHL